MSTQEFIDAVDTIQLCKLEDSPLYVLRSSSLSLKGVSQESASTVLGHMMHCLAKESLMTEDRYTIENSNAETLDVLDKLSDAGVVAKAGSTNDTSSWIITFVGEEMIETCTRIKGTTPAISANLEKAFNQMTVYELLSYLYSKGWYGEVWRDKASHPDPVQVSNGTPTVWWIRDGS
eukprot:9488016-Pyramimonas_sp.AAC.1